jgi:hypothetical protein
MNKYDLISRGYFPKELPPPFQTKSLADFINNHKNQLQYSSNIKTAKLYSHNQVRYGSLRRKLNIPNPAFFTRICNVIEDAWDDLDVQFTQSHLSKSKPTFTPYPSRNRSISPFLEFYKLPIERAKNRSSGRYILHTDI